jgi:hypothetical protein
MAKKKVISIIPDDLFEDREINPIVNVFGSFRVIGDLELLATSTTKKTTMSLYYNNLTNKFLLVFNYTSGNHYVIFFNHSTYQINNLCTLDYLINEEIARMYENKSEIGLLYYNTWDRMFTFVNESGLVKKLRKV